MSNRVDCINKTNRTSPWERITSLGGVRDDNGQRWSCSQQECIRHIENGVRFYVQKNGHSVDLVVGISQSGNKYVKTEADSDKQDNLLSLPECR